MQQLEKTMIKKQNCNFKIYSIIEYISDIKYLIYYRNNINFLFFHFIFSGVYNLIYFNYKINYS